MAHITRSGRKLGVDANSFFFTPAARVSQRALPMAQKCSVLVFKELCNCVDHGHPEAFQRPANRKANQKPVFLPAIGNGSVRFSLSKRGAPLSRRQKRLP